MHIYALTLEYGSIGIGLRAPVPFASSIYQTYEVSDARLGDISVALDTSAAAFADPSNAALACAADVLPVL